MTSRLRGRFITLEGGEGVGKSTQMLALKCALEARSLSVITTREPGGSIGAETIRSLLLGGNPDAWHPRAEALLFAAARSDHIERLIEPALAAGQWVLCDRFIDSSRAYQGGALGLSDADILAVHSIACSGLMPDRTLLLTAPTTVTTTRRIARQGSGPDRFEIRSDEFHASVEQAFMTIALAEPQRVRRVDADGAPSLVTTRLMQELADLLP